MRTARQTILAITAVSATLLVFSIGTLIAQPGRSGKPDPKKPVPATDVTLVKKVSLKGGRPAGGGAAKKVEAATGVLGSPVTGRKYAVVVGISDYPGTGSDLSYAHLDAIDMAAALDEVYEFDQVTLLTNLDATREAILTAIEALSPGSNDEVVFFFSGHGMNGIAQDSDPEKMDEALVAHDGSKLVPIWDGELQGAFAGLGTERIVFIFDVCLAGGMDDVAGSGRVVLMASGEHGYSYEGDQWEHGEFTYYLVDRGIVAGQANIHDYEHDTELSEPQQVTVEEGFDFVKANCQLDRPVISDDFANDLLP